MKMPPGAGQPAGAVNCDLQPDRLPTCLHSCAARRRLQQEFDGAEAVGAAAAAPLGADGFPLTAAGEGFPVRLESQCYADLSLYLVYKFDAAAHSGAACLNVPEPGMCQQYAPLAAGGRAASAYPSLQPLAWAILEDSDAYATPANVTGIDGADIMGANCTEGAEGCLAKFEVCVCGGVLAWWTELAGAGEGAFARCALRACWQFLRQHGCQCSVLPVQLRCLPALPQPRCPALPCRLPLPREADPLIPPVAMLCSLTSAATLCSSLVMIGRWGRRPPWRLQATSCLPLRQTPQTRKSE